MSRLPVSGFGLTALANPRSVVFNAGDNMVPKPFILNRELNEKLPVNNPLLPEKCVFSHSNEETLWCAYEKTKLPSEFPDQWYRGSFSFKDSLWRINLVDGQVVELVNTLTESGREVDVVDLTLSSDEAVLYLINKNDNTLWMYEI